MQTIRKTKQNKYQVITLIIVAYMVTFLLTSLTPLIADDYNYAFSWAGGKRVDNLVMVYQSMSVHRIWTHGRVFASGLTTLFMMWPKLVFNLSNASIVTFFFIILFFYYKRTNSGNPLLACAAVAIIYWICTPCFGQVFLWLVGACNYFWGIVLCWFLIEMVQMINSKRHSTLVKLGLFPIAFFAGAWSEHISFSAIVIQTIHILRQGIQKRRIPLFDVLILLVSGTGYLYLMFAPSMMGSKLMKRAQIVTAEHRQSVIAIISRFWWIIPVLFLLLALAYLLLMRLPTRRQRGVVLITALGICCMVACVGVGVKEIIAEGLYGLISSTPFCFFLLLSLFCFGLCLALLHRADCEAIIDAVILFAGGASALVPFAFALYVPARGFCAPVVFIGIATVRLWSSVQTEIKKRAFLILVLFFVVFCHIGLSDILAVHNAATRRNEAIDKALATDGVLITTPYPEKTRYSAQYGLQDLTPDGDWPNNQIKEYYGLKKIVVVD